MKYIAGFFIVLSMILTLQACKEQVSDKGVSGKAESREFEAGALRMRDTLDAIFARTDFRLHPYESQERIKVMEQELRDLQATGGKNNNPMEYARILLDAGRSGDAIFILTKVIEANPNMAEVNDQSRGLYELLGIAYLRLGEQENCIRNHNEETCIFPIQGKGVHQVTQGSRGAIQVYEQILDQYPNDYQSMYLLNLAYQTLGEYPDKVPSRFLIPPDKFKSEMPFEKWRNVASLIGVADNFTAGGSILDDFDNDGLIDILQSSWQMKGPIRFYKNKGDGTYEDRTATAGLGSVTGGLNMIQADYNNDGHLDFLLLRGAWKPRAAWAPEPNSLFRNNGDGTFSDVTFESGIYTVRPTQAAVWFDFNNDGWLDLFIGNETSTLDEPWPSEFYINQKDGTFREASREVGLYLISHIKGVASADINNDGWMDLFISVQGGDNVLYLNRDGNVFTTVTDIVGLNKPIFSFPCIFFDVNQDGWEDLLVVSYDFYGSVQQAYEVTAHLLGKPFNSEVASMFINKGNGTFENKAKEYGLARPIHGMGINIGDLTNNGYPDLYIGTGAPDYRSIVPNRLYFNVEGKKFADITEASGFGNIQKGHAISFADLDNDGDQDVFANMGGAYSGDFFPNSLFLNPGSDNNWVTLRLEGTTSNKSAIGARVRLTVAEPDGTSRQWHYTCNSGGSFGANSLQLEIGLGQATQIEKVEINWPDGKNQFEDFGSTGVNRILKAMEGEGKLRSVQFERIQWKLDGHGISSTPAESH